MESMRKIRKRAIFFTIDAFIASGILFVGLLIISSFHVNSQPIVHLSYLSEDLTGVFSELKVSEINSPYVASLISDGNITHLNNSVMEQIGEFWAENNNGLAQNFTEAVLGGIIPEKYGYSVLVDDEEILHNDGSLNNSLISSRKIASGYAKLKPVLGFTSKIFLTSIKNRKSSSVVYFGGFEGEGNITKKIFLPQNLTNITEIYLEILPGTDFNLYINDNFAGSYPRGSGNSTFLIPGSWYVDQSYWNYFTAGENEIKISFEYINENFTAEGPKYVGGGYLKVVYTTPDTEELEVTYYSEDLAGKKYWFPGIEGFINTYSSTYIPGNLTSMKIYLNFVSNYITYLTIGGTTVYEAQGEGDTEVTLTDSQLSSIFSNEGISYANLSMVTLPIRIGLKNITRTSAPLDSVLITDVSGSMRWRMDRDNVNGAQRECNDPNLNDNSTERLSIAKCAGKDFVDTILNNEGPLVGLVSYEDSTDSTLWLTDNKTELNNEIESYSASGSTCICCGINDAVDMLINDTQIGFITRKSTGWKYDDNDLSSDPSGWTSAGFDDSGWSEGQAGLGNGYAGLNTIISKYDGYYYFRKKFDITNISDVQAAKLFVYSDDGADVYVNGNLIDNNVDSSHTAAYWNREIDINTTDLVEGENIVVVKLRNRRTCFFIWCWDTDVAFDLEFAGSSSELIEQAKKKAIVVMSDGEANQECARQGNSGDLNNDGQYDTAKDDAIKAACDAYADYGITVYSVGFGIGADATTLQYMANCTDGSYFSSANYEELRDTYLIIANELIEFTETQRVNQTDILTSILYPDSYIEFNYTPEVPAPVYGQIPVTAEGNRFGNNISEGNFFIPDGNTLIDLIATSYSADKWTDLVSVYNPLGDYTAFNLSKYGSYYRDIGDAFTVNIPVSKIVTGDNNTVTVKTATDPGNLTGGSEYNRLIYTVRIDSLLDYGGVFLESEGCIWHVEFEDETNDTIKIPSDYSGAEQCYYANATYSANDALDDATYRLFSNLDFDGDGKLEVSLDENNIDLDTLTVSDVPSLWGPAIVEVRIW